MSFLYNISAVARYALGYVNNCRQPHRDCQHLTTVTIITNGCNLTIANHQSVPFVHRRKHSLVVLVNPSMINLNNISIINLPPHLGYPTLSENYPFR